MELGLRKFKIKSTEHSAAIQHKLKELGYLWGGIAKTIPQYPEATALYIEDRNKHITYTDSIDDTYFNEHAAKEITLDDLFTVDLEMTFGKWYNLKGYIICFQGKDEPSFGFTDKGKWSNDIRTYRLSGTPVKREELFSLLSAEALKRGFTHDYSYQSVDGFIYSVKEQNHFFWNETLSLCCKIQGGVIFKKGKWGKIVPTPPVIQGYKGEYDKEKREISFGCMRFSLDFATSSSFSNIRAIDIDHNLILKSELTAIFDWAMKLK